MKHLLQIEGMDRDDLERLLVLTETFVEVGHRPIPKVPALRGKTIVSLFYEDSTRTRLSFETAARRLSADVMNFGVSTSSTKKGESLRDTVQTISSFGVDAIVVRHSGAGAPHLVTHWTQAAVVNAGDGAHEHPTQALLDAFTIRDRFGSLEGRRIAIVGDIAHSRVARSNVAAFVTLGAEVVLVAPPTLLPPAVSTWPVSVAGSIDEVVGDVDVCYLLRMQTERMHENLLPSDREYHHRFGLTVRRADRMPAGSLIMHPGPMNRGVELASEVADRENAVVTEQVGNGVAVRMAVLFALLSTPAQVENLTAVTREDAHG